MITLFLIIAFCIRKRFVREDAGLGDKVFYYALNVILTPLIAPWIYRMIYDSKTEDENEDISPLYYTYVG